MPTKEEVFEALRGVEDPELGMDIVELGLLYDVEVQGPRVKVIHRFPPETHPPIRYVAVLLTEEGRPLFEALSAPAALERARRLGFETLGRR